MELFYFLYSEALMFKMAFYTHVYHFVNALSSLINHQLKLG